jgi:hypothetical protein
MLLTKAFDVENPMPPRFTPVTRIVLTRISPANALATFCLFIELGMCGSSHFGGDVIREFSG